MQDIHKHNFSRNKTKKPSISELSLKGLGFCLRTSLTEFMQP